MRIDSKHRYSYFLKALSLTVRLSSNSPFFLDEFRQIASAFRFSERESGFNAEYEALIGNGSGSKSVLTKDSRIHYSTSNWVDLLLKLHECISNDFIRSTRDHYYLVHSAVLVRRGKAIIIPGASKSGKSTLTIALLKEGFKYLSDEIAAIDPDTLETSGFPRAIRVREKTLTLFPALEPEVTYRRYRLSNSGRIKEIHYGIPSRKSLASMERSFPISAIIFPQYGGLENGALLIEISPPSVALFNLMQCSINQGRLKEKGFKIAVRLVKQTKCYSLKTKDLARACEAISALFG